MVDLFFLFWSDVLIVRCPYYKNGCAPPTNLVVWKMPARSKRRASRKKRYHRGGARFVRRPTLQDKIAEGVSMFLSGPAPSFTTAGVFLGKQAFKGIKDNVDHFLKAKRRRRR